eukprot:596819-Karenia_brevis.AAC.1
MAVVSKGGADGCVIGNGESGNGLFGLGVAGGGPAGEPIEIQGGVVLGSIGGRLGIGCGGGRLGIGCGHNRAGVVPKELVASGRP